MPAGKGPPWTLTEVTILRRGITRGATNAELQVLLPGRTAAVIGARRSAIRARQSCHPGIASHLDGPGIVGSVGQALSKTEQTDERERGHSALDAWFKRHPEQPNSGKPALMAPARTADPFRIAASC